MGSIIPEWYDLPPQKKTVLVVGQSKSNHF